MPVVAKAKMNGTICFSLKRKVENGVYKLNKKTPDFSVRRFLGNIYKKLLHG
jgi:hypothetical protein